ncbi:hypothetical protein [Tuwongella immobilis]|uniref:Uncharacterized protein n=1 Tax=Tuwongella immobilis TaxID=692036 RepID=A0A6C2YN68_9BACT|nr:hypothetical protein [Tuwongella immobilis]VIP03060.1 unnamed protein product [Tuwongella immobilis]VTS03267.1 unnamed protein product [Tuwongella immobilis]
MATLSGPFGLLPRTKAEITLITGGGTKAGDFDGRVFYHRESGTHEIWISTGDGKYAVISGGGAGTVAVGANGGLSGNGTTGDPLRLDLASLAESTAIMPSSLIAFSNGVSGDTNYVTISDFYDVAHEGDVAYVSGKSAVQTIVAAIRGRTVSNSTPTTGQVLTYNGTEWTPASLPASPPPPPTPTITISGAVTGSGTTLISTALAANVVTYANLQAASANIVLGRGNTAGDIVELPCLSIARSLMAASGAPAARAVLGLGDLAQMNVFPGQTFGHTAMTTNSADIGTSWANVGIATASLDAGHYDITLDYRFIISSTTSAYVEFRLIDDLGAVVQDNPGDSIRFAFSTNQVGVILQGTSSVHWAHTASAGRVLRLQARCTTSGGGTTTPVQVRSGTIGYTILRWRKVY